MENTTNVIRKSALAPTILISGGAGFIGSHLAEALLLKDANVVVLDNFSTGKKEYLNNIINNPKFTLIRCDINEGIPANIESVDYVFHLASVESYIYSNNVITLDSLLTNALGTKNLLDLAKKSNAKFLLVSSLSVYQGQIASYDMAHYFGQNPIEEKKYTHSEAKRFAEALVWEYYKRNKTDARIVRVPEVYGPRMDFDSCAELGRLSKQLLNEQDLTVYGDGLEKNYYLYISDVINGIIKAQFSDGSDGKIYSLTGNDPVTTIELTYLLKALANSEIRINFKESKVNKFKDPVVSNTESYKDLKWSPKVALKDGLAKTLKWYNYEFNLNSFKPAKYIVKEKEEMPAINSLIPETKTVAAEEPKQEQILKEIVSSTPTAIDSIRFGAQATQTPSSAVKKQRSLPKINIFPKISEKLRSFHVSLPKINQDKTNVNLMPLWGALIALVLSFTFFAVLPATRTYYFANNGYKNLEKSQKNIEALNLEEGQKEGMIAATDFKKAELELTKLGWIFVSLNQEARLRNYAKILKIAEYSALAITSSADGTKPLTSIWESVKPNSQITIDEAILSKSVLNFKSAHENLERAQAELGGIKPEYLDNSMKDKMHQVSLKLPEALKVIEVAQNFTEEAPQMLGFDEPKRYLILFENPTELRANGGFVGSYAVMLFDKGKIKELTIDDIYNIDGLLDLNGLKTPSYAPVKKYLKQDFLRIRDANWQADFPSSASTILDLFEKANGAKFDGVFAMDTYLVQDFIRTLGPIYLTAYNEEINADNLYERTQYHAEADYTQGSQQKRAFLTILGSKLLETIFSSEKSKVSLLSKDIFNNLNEKHLLAYLPKSKVSALISQNNWDGKVNTTKGDYIFIVDSNLGANKADYFIKRNASYKVKNTYRDGALEVLLTINYEHTGKDNTWPGGPYTDYLRVLVPNESFLHKATFKIGEAETDITKQVIVEKEAGKRTFETAFILNPQEKASIVFNYTLPASISLNKGENIYSLYWQKQPGTEGMPINVEFEEPFGKQITSTTPEFKKENNTFKYSTNLTQDFKAVLQIK